MRLVEVDPYDDEQLEVLTRIVEEARAQDDPDAFALTIEDIRNEVRYGADLHPDPFTLLLDDDGVAVGHLALDASDYDNRHVVHARFTVRPDRRGEGFGSRLVTEIVRRTRDLGRTTLWIGVAEDDAASTTFLERRGFVPVSPEARRFQVLADVDPAEVDRLERDAAEHRRDYVLERLEPPYDDALLASLVDVTAAINDAPMGALTREDEVFDLGRLQDQERARALRGERFRRVVARHRGTGELGGHTYLVVRPWAPTIGEQWDTAVAREHRGHRLGLALKIEMMRWMAEAEPQITVVETWNNVENTLMIKVNEALGYRLSRRFVIMQRELPTGS